MIKAILSDSGKAKAWLWKVLKKWPPASWKSEIHLSGGYFQFSHHLFHSQSFFFGHHVYLYKLRSLAQSHQKMSHAHYPSSHNHGSEKWVPPIVATFQIQPFSTFRIMGGGTCNFTSRTEAQGTRPYSRTQQTSPNAWLRHDSHSPGSRSLFSTNGARLIWLGYCEKCKKWWYKSGLELCIQCITSLRCKENIESKSARQHASDGTFP